MAQDFVRISDYDALPREVREALADARTFLCGLKVWIKVDDPRAMADRVRRADRTTIAGSNADHPACDLELIQMILAGERG